MKQRIYTAILSEFEVQKAGEWYRFTNPFDKKSQTKQDKTMCFNPSYSWVKCFRTGYSKPALEFLQDYWGVTYDTAKRTVKTFDESQITEIVTPTKQVGEIQLPEHFKPLSIGNGLLAHRARTYLQSRGFNVNRLDALGFGYFDEGDYLGYILIPYYSYGKLVYYTLRSFMEHPIKYYNLPTKYFGIGKSDILFNEDALNIFDRVYIVEGALDALTLGSNACAISGWKFSDTQKRKVLQSSCKELVFVPDKGFYKETLKEAVKFIYEKDVFVIDTRMFEIGKDVNDWGKHNIKMLENQTFKLTFGQYLKDIK